MLTQSERALLMGVETVTSRGSHERTFSGEFSNHKSSREPKKYPNLNLQTNISAFKLFK